MTYVGWPPAWFFLCITPFPYHQLSWKPDPACVNLNALPDLLKASSANRSVELVHRSRGRCSICEASEKAPSNPNGFMGAYPLTPGPGALTALCRSTTPTLGSQATFPTGILNKW